MRNEIFEISEAIINPPPLWIAPPETTLPQANRSLATEVQMPAANLIPEAALLTQPIGTTPPETPLGGHNGDGIRSARAAQDLSGTAGADEGHYEAVTLRSSALVGEIDILCRRYNDLRRAKQRLELQAMATCRSLCDGDKAAGAKLYRAPTPEVEALLLPYLLAMEPLTCAIAEQEKLLTKLGGKLPVAAWAKGIAGLSPRFLALIIGECGRIGPGDYRTVSALWKRMGMAVIGGERQRRVTGGAAIEHGYVARRRALMWNIGESILKQQVRKLEDETRCGIGAYGALYLERKVHEATKTDKPVVAHSRAKRYVEKRLLRELWKAWRRDLTQSSDREIYELSDRPVSPTNQRQTASLASASAIG